jgi:protein-S-isoprenylcysteine O-methyltransferase
MTNVERSLLPHQPKSLSGIALRAFCLGIALAVGLLSMAFLLVFTNSGLWRIAFFLAALSTFHFLEFWTTAAYNTPAATVGSYLLTSNWPAYAIAHSSAAVECLFVNVVFPDRAWAPLHSGPLLRLLGFAAVAAGQTIRSAAMVQAGPSFNHIVQQQRGVGHVLVTTGIYSSLRHPSYFGFFWWALGTQLVMGNVVCFFAYAVFLWYFFSTRIKGEEELLVRFFGEEYIDYKKRVGTKIPFIA